MLHYLRRQIARRIEPHLNSIKPNHPLNTKLAISSLGTHFYRYGIVFYKRPGFKAKFFYNPYLILLLEMLFFTRALFSLFVPDCCSDYFAFAGDYFKHAKAHINVAASQYMMIGISVLLMNYYRYFKGNRPIFLQSLEWLNGRGTPKSAGLQNPTRVMRLIIRSRMILSITHYNTRLVLIASFFLHLLPMLFNLTFNELIFNGIPWSLVFAVASHHTFGAYYWNNAYFYILCHQVKARLEEVDDLAQRIPAKSRQFQHSMVKQLKCQHQSINDNVQLYSSTYFATYLFLSVGFLVTFNNTVLYAALFNTRMDMMIRVILFYATSLSSIAILFILNTASLVYRQSSRACLTLNGLYVLIHNRSNFRTLLKLSTLIEDCTRKQVGFYFFNLFIIRSFKFAEILAFIIAYFMKITDMSRVANLN